MHDFKFAFFKVIFCVFLNFLMEFSPICFFAFLIYFNLPLNTRNEVFFATGLDLLFFGVIIISGLKF